MLAAVPPLVALVGLGLYFVPVAAGRPVFRRVPWETLALVALGAVAGVVLLVQAPSAARAAGALVALALLAFSGWFFFRYSMYGAREDRPAVGDRFPDFTLVDSTGRTFHLAEAGDRRRLIMLYRGYW
jgi:hypothetical protein